MEENRRNNKIMDYVGNKFVSKLGDGNYQP